MICKVCKQDKPDKKFYWSKTCLDCLYLDKLQKLKEAQERKKTRMLENYAEKTEKKIERQTNSKANKLIKKLKGIEIYSYSKHLEKTATKMQLYCRLRDADSDWNCKCVTCWEIWYYKEMNWWHWMSRKHRKTMLDERNIHTQCITCNKINYWERKKYKDFMIHTYWWVIVDYLESWKWKPYKYTREELDNINEWLDIEIEKLRKYKTLY